MNNWRAHGLLLLAAFIWGSSNVAQQNVLHYLGPITTVGLRCVLASLVILPFVWRSKSELPRIWALGRWPIILTSILFGLSTTLAQTGIGKTSVINASFFINTWTVIMPFCVWLVLGVRPTIMILPAAGLTLLGTCFISGGSLSSLNNGDLLCLLAAFFYTCWAISLSEFVRKFDNAYFISFVQFLIIGFGCSALGLWLEPINLANLQLALPDLLLIGIFSTGVGYVLQAVAQAKTSLCVAAIILSLEAVFGAIAGILLLGETFTPTTLSGAGLIFAGVVLAQFTCEATPIPARKAIANTPITALTLP